METPLRAQLAPKSVGNSPGLLSPLKSIARVSDLTIDVLPSPAASRISRLFYWLNSLPSASCLLATNFADLKDGRVAFDVVSELLGIDARDDPDYTPQDRWLLVIELLSLSEYQNFIGSLFLSPEAVSEYCEGSVAPLFYLFCYLQHFALHGSGPLDVALAPTPSPTRRRSVPKLGHRERSPVKATIRKVAGGFNYKDPQTEQRKLRPKRRVRVRPRKLKDKVEPSETATLGPTSAFGGSLGGYSDQLRKRLSTSKRKESHKSTRTRRPKTAKPSSSYVAPKPPSASLSRSGSASGFHEADSAITEPSDNYSAIAKTTSQKRPHSAGSEPQPRISRPKPSRRRKPVKTIHKAKGARLRADKEKTPMGRREIRILEGISAVIETNNVNMWRVYFGDARPSVPDSLPYNEDVIRIIGEGFLLHDFTCAFFREVKLGHLFPSPSKLAERISNLRVSLRKWREEKNLASLSLWDEREIASGDSSRAWQLLEDLVRHTQKRRSIRRTSSQRVEPVEAAGVERKLDSLLVTAGTTTPASFKARTVVGTDLPDSALPSSASRTISRTASLRLDRMRSEMDRTPVSKPVTLHGPKLASKSRTRSRSQLSVSETIPHSEEYHHDRSASPSKPQVSSKTQKKATTRSRSKRAKTPEVVKHEQTSQRLSSLLGQRAPLSQSRDGWIRAAPSSTTAELGPGGSTADIGCPVSPAVPPAMSVLPVASVLPPPLPIRGPTASHLTSPLACQLAAWIQSIGVEVAAEQLDGDILPDWCDGKLLQRIAYCLTGAHLRYDHPDTAAVRVTNVRAALGALHPPLHTEDVDEAVVAAIVAGDRQEITRLVLKIYAAFKQYQKPVSEVKKVFTPKKKWQRE